MGVTPPRAYSRFKITPTVFKLFYDTLKAYSDNLNYRNYSSRMLSLLFMVIMSSSATEIKME